jgi:UDP-N-acetylmuramate--alanine ligase
VTLALAGEHNVRNALAAVAVARLLGVQDTAIQQALAGFGGAGRRLQAHGQLPCAGGGCYTLVDDYGHHPAELAAVLAAARGAWPGRRLVAVFQPHRYSRTRDCLADFAAVLARFDAVLLTEVYAAGEAPLPGADGATLAARVPGAHFVARLQDLAPAVRAAARDGDVVLTLGAGSIDRLPAELKALMEEKE